MPSALDFGVTKWRHTVAMALAEPDSVLGMIAFFTLMGAIVTSIVMFCIQSLPENRIRDARGEYGDTERTFAKIELICVLIFTAEYLGRLLTITAVPPPECLAVLKFTLMEKRTAAEVAVSSTLRAAAREAKAAGQPPPQRPRAPFIELSLDEFASAKWNADVSARQAERGSLSATLLLAHKNARLVLSWLFSLFNIIDAAAIFPYYIILIFPGSLGSGTSILRVMRLARVLRIARNSKSFKGVEVMGKTLVGAADALGFLLFLVGLALVLLGTLVFFCEGGVWDEDTGHFMRQDYRNQFQEVTPIVSIPHAFWYAMVTITTVGYGDMYPTTDAGRIVGTLTMITGMIVLAMPITVIGSAFSAEYKIMKVEAAAEAAATEIEQALFERLVIVEEALMTGVEEHEAEAAGDEAAAVFAAKKGGAKVATEPLRSPSMRRIGAEATSAPSLSTAASAAAASEEAGGAARSLHFAPAGVAAGAGADALTSLRGLAPGEPEQHSRLVDPNAPDAAVLELLRGLRGQLEAQSAELRGRLEVQAAELHQLRKETHALKCEMRKSFAAL